MFDPPPPTSCARNRAFRRPWYDLALAPLMRLWLALLIFAILCGGAAPAAAVGKKRRAAKSAWTLMVYQDADNSLETPQLANLKEMLQVGGSDGVQVVVLCDRSPKSEPKDQYSDEPIGGLADWSGAKLLHVEKGRLKQLADWGKTNMADPETLRRFVEAAAKAYPAEHYGLILADHGSGWEELCVDETHDDQALNLRDLRTALEPFVAAHGKLDLVGLDACLMASFETAQALQPVAHEMIASEELAPARGWNYDVLLKAMDDKPSLSAAEVGRAIVDAYTIYFRASKDAMERYSSLGATLSVLDLDQLGPLVADMSALGDRCTAALREGRAGWLKVARAKSRAEEYGAMGVRGEGSEEEMHDLIHLMQLLEASGDPAIADAAKQVEAAVKHVVRYGMHGPCRPHAGGLSVYFPTDGVSLNDPKGSAYLSHTFAKECRWINFLSLYSVAVNDYAEKPHLPPIKATGKTASLEHPVEILSKVTADDVASVHFLMLAPNGADMLIIGRLPTHSLPDGTLAQLFKGTWFVLSDKKRGVTCPITAFEELNEDGTRYLAYVPAQIRRAGSPDWIDVQFTFLVTVDKSAPRGQLLYAFADTKQGPLQISLRKGDAIRPVYTSIKPTGETADWTSDRGSILLDQPDDFSMQWGLVSKGAYQLGFEVINLAGQPDVVLDDFNLE